jgi:hypothetical protein
MSAEPALRAAARFGPYFTWDRWDGEPFDGEPFDGEPDWRPLSDLTDGDVLAERVAVARHTLITMTGLNDEDVAERVVASVTFLGLASRLLSPVLAAVAAADALPLAVPDRLWWRPVAGGPVPIAWRGLDATDCAGRDSADVADELVRVAVRGLVEPVLAAFRHRFVLSDHVLWGNVASALGGAAGMIADAGDAAPADAGDAAPAERAAAIVTQMLALQPLRGTATMERPDRSRARWFLVRRNCCLYYRIPGGGTCGDCVLTPDEVRRRQWRSVLAAHRR